MYIIFKNKCFYKSGQHGKTAANVVFRIYWYDSTQTSSSWITSLNSRCKRVGREDAEECACENFPVIRGGGGLQMRQLELSCFFSFWIFAYFLLPIEGEMQTRPARSNEPWTSPFSLVVGPHTLHSALPWDANLIY